MQSLLPPEVDVAVVPLMRSAPKGASELLALLASVSASTPGFRLRVVLFAVLGGALGVMDGLLFVFLKELGAHEWLDGVALTFTCLSEVAIFFYAKELEARFGATGCLHIVCFCYTARLVYYSLLGSLGSVWLVLPAQLLHGVTFGLLWAIGNRYMRRCAPEGLESTLQGLFQALIQSGSFLGLLTAAAVVQRYGLARTFGVFAALTAAAHAALYSLDDEQADGKAASEAPCAVEAAMESQPAAG
jgi:Na+/melibiose symporter-like transporter